MSEGSMFAIGPCLLCGMLHSFDIEEAPSVITDRQTERVAAEGTPQEFWVRKPVCEQCADIVERLAAEEGRPPKWPRRAARLSERAARLQARSARKAR